jgi:hypothetical protein
VERISKTCLKEERICDVGWQIEMRGGLGYLEEEKAGRKRRETEDQLAYCTTAVTGPLQDGTDLGIGAGQFFQSVWG